MLCLALSVEKILDHQPVQAKTKIIHVQPQPVLVLVSKDGCIIGVYISNLLFKLLSHLLRQNKLNSEMTK